MKAAAHPKFPAIVDLHRKLEVLCMPLAKHEVRKQKGRSHYPTSIWRPETGRVGRQVFDPDDNSNKLYDRTQLANEFLNATATLSVPSADPEKR
jgi:hypothetical protein